MEFSRISNSHTGVVAREDASKYPFLKKLARVVLLFTILLWMSPAVLRCQVDTGSIQGTVRDNSGAVLTNARIILVDEATGYKRGTQTSNEGTYLFTAVKVGHYSLTAQAAGFKETQKLDVQVNVQQQAAVDLTLTVGQATQSVEVNTAPPLLQVESGAVGQVVESHQINVLPLNGRNFTYLAQLVAGVSQGSQDTRGLGNSGSFSANGTRSTESNYLLDGIDNNNYSNNFYNGTYYALLPPVDAISEFNMQTNSYSAEQGRAGGAILNVTTKSGGNQFHGDLWEFVRNNILDAHDYFQTTANAEFRMNQFGFTIGGPVILPRLYNGHNKIFFFADYQGARIRQAYPFTSTVPTAAERASGFTNFSDLIAGLSGSRTDLLGRTYPSGTIFDPATTRPVTKGTIDPVTTLLATGTGYVRDSFHGNVIPGGRLDQNAITLLNLYPAPTKSTITSNYVDDPVGSNDTDQFDIRVDQNFGSKDQLFGRFSFFNNPGVGPAPLPGLAEGGGTALSGGAPAGNILNTGRGLVVSETHIFSPKLINEARFGIVLLGNNVTQNSANVAGVPAQYGIQGVPAAANNGGLPFFSMGELSSFGVPEYLPVVRSSNIYQGVDNITKIFTRHSVKAGGSVEYMEMPWLQPPAPRGAFDFNGEYTSVVNATDGSTAIAQLLLKPTATMVPNGVNNLGAADQVSGSNFTNHSMFRWYYAAYMQDDWKATDRLTVNAGMRWEYFGSQQGSNGQEVNFTPLPGFVGAQLRIPQANVSALPQSFVQAAAANGISIVPSSNALTVSQKDNFGPRLGLAYSASNRLVFRAGYGIFFDGLDAASGASSVTGGFPFVVSSSFTTANAITPLTSNNSIGLLENGLLNVPISSQGITNFGGIGFEGIQHNLSTAYTQGLNLMTQYLIAPTLSVQVGYVGSLARHLLTEAQPNPVTQILPPNGNPQSVAAYPTFVRGGNFAVSAGSSFYHALQVTLQKSMGHGLSFLADYTWGKTRTDAHDLIGNGEIGGYRAPGVAGFGIHPDFALADFDMKDIAHFSGTYELPFGTGRAFLSNSSRWTDAFLGGWSTNWILNMETGQPGTINCTITTTAGLGCFALRVPGQPTTTGNVSHFFNAAAFTNPATATAASTTDYAPLGGTPTQVYGPGFGRLDYSIFKQFHTTETTYFEFRAEAFNLTNHPNFAWPSNTSFASPSTFGQITSTRDNPNDPREFQLALKYYW